MPTSFGIGSVGLFYVRRVLSKGRLSGVLFVIVFEDLWVTKFRDQSDFFVHVFICKFKTLALITPNFTFEVPKFQLGFLRPLHYPRRLTFKSPLMPKIPQTAL